jgi:restriction endonuclease S subunit
MLFKVEQWYRWKINIPSLEEQEKIASFLGAVDRHLTQLRRKQKLLQTYKRGVMQKIFSQEIRFKGAIGSPFPDWQKKKLGELGTFLGGGTPSTSQKNYWTGGKILWISSSDLEEDSIYKISITRFINETAIKESATKRVPPNSILIISRVGVGKIAVSKQEVCTSQDFSNFTPNQGNVYFLAYLLISQKNKLLSISQGTSIKGFTNYDLSLLKIDFPCIEEQEKIVYFLTAIDRKIETLSRQIDQTEQFKKGLLQKLFV